MDDISRVWFSLHFRNAYLEKKGSAFEEWFTKLAADAFGADFELVRACGGQGDWKCDGRQLSTATVFQCYAPETPMDKVIPSQCGIDIGPKPYRCAGGGETHARCPPPSDHGRSVRRSFGAIDINAHVMPTRLTDATEDGGLFGIRFS